MRLKKVLPTLPSEVSEIAWKAQERLHRKFTKLTFHRTPAGKVATAVARELVGFIWAIGHHVETRNAEFGSRHSGSTRPRASSVASSSSASSLSVKDRILL